MSSKDWWANRLNGSPLPTDLAPSYPPQPASYPPQPASYPQQPASYPQQPQQNLPESALSGERCPGCGSNNYMQMSSGGVATERGIVKVKRCYDCGYPLANQSGAGMKGISVPLAGPSQKTRQVPTAGWNPSVVDKSFV